MILLWGVRLLFFRILFRAARSAPPPFVGAAARGRRTYYAGAADGIQNYNLYRGFTRWDKIRKNSTRHFGTLQQLKNVFFEIKSEKTAGVSPTQNLVIRITDNK